MLKKILTLLKHSYLLRKIHGRIRVSHSRARIENHGIIRLIKDIEGKDNSIYVGKDSFLDKTIIRIRGNGNKLIIGDGCYVGPRSSFWLEGNGVSIVIGDRVTFTRDFHCNAQEDGMSILIGDDCMFSNNIIVRTSDSHPIFDLHSGERLNPAAPVTIGKNVWVAPQTIVMKGVAVGSGSILGSRAIVTKSIPDNVLAVGSPAKVVKTDVSWSRDRLF